MAATKSGSLKNTSLIMEKIELGMSKVKEDLIAYKKAKKSDLVVLKGDKVVHVKP